MVIASPTLYAYAHNPLSWIDPLGLTNALVTYCSPNDSAFGPVEVSVLEKGTLIDRYGYPGGKYTSPLGTPYSMRALASGTVTKPYIVYEVMKPILNVSKSKIAPWFGEIAIGTKYLLPESVQSLIDSKHLKEVKRGKCG